MAIQPGEEIVIDRNRNVGIAGLTDDPKKKFADQEIRNIRVTSDDADVPRAVKALVVDKFGDTSVGEIKKLITVVEQMVTKQDVIIAILNAAYNLDFSENDVELK